MKPVPMALLGTAAALVAGFALSYSKVESPADATAVSPPTSAAAFPRMATEPTDARIPGAGSVEAIATAVAALKHEVASLKDAVAALQQSAATAEPTPGLAALQAEIANLWRQVRAQNSAAAGVADSEHPADHHPRRDAVTRAEAERQRQAQRQAMETSFGQEPLDPPWASQATLVLQQALADSATEPVTVRAIECRSQTCRVELTGSRAETLAPLIPALAERVADTLPSITANQTQEETGAATLILYLSRQVEESS